MPLEDTLFRLLPIELQKGQEISVCAVMFSQGINEQQSIADRIGDNSLQDAINIENFRTLKQYLSQLSSHFALAGKPLLDNKMTSVTICISKNPTSFH